jgi:hypothetical protein
LCEHRLNPKDRNAVAEMLKGRERQFAYLRHVDALVMIDSDPGGYIGSKNQEFVALMGAQLRVFRRFNPSVKMVYWMWVGWENYNEFWAEAAAWRPGDPRPEFRTAVDDYTETLSMMKKHIPEPWAVLACNERHRKVTDQLGLQAKRRFFPYGLIEREPSFPMTNCDPKPIADGLSAYSKEAYPQGVMANAQTHVLQVPNTCLFAHLARGGAPGDANLFGFAEAVLPDCSAEIAEGWQAIESGCRDRQRLAAVHLRDRVGKEHRTGPSTGLVVGDANRFLTDLAINLEIRAGLSELRCAIDADRDVKRALRVLLESLQPYQKRLGFSDACGGPLLSELRKLARYGCAAVNEVLDDFENWRDPPVRHGALPRLLDALDQFSRGC